MDSIEKEQLRQKILQQIEKFKTEIIQLEDATQPISPENAIGRVSRMDAINNKSVAEAALRSVKKRLVSLKIALDKLHAAEFGICSRCGNAIQAGRLMYMPESSTCVKCADR